MPPHVAKLIRQKLNAPAERSGSSFSCGSAGTVASRSATAFAQNASKSAGDGLPFSGSYPTPNIVGLPFPVDTVRRRNPGAESVPDRRNGFSFARSTVRFACCCGPKLSTMAETLPSVTGCPFVPTAVTANVAVSPQR